MLLCFYEPIISPVYLPPSSAGRRRSQRSGSRVCWYDADLEDLRQGQEKLWEAAEHILSALAALK